MSLIEAPQCPFCKSEMGGYANAQGYRYVCTNEKCCYGSPFASGVEAARQWVRRTIVAASIPEPRRTEITWYSIRDRKPPDRGQDYHYLAIVDDEWQIISADEVIERATWWAEKEPASP